MGKKTAIIPGWLVLVAILWVPFFGGCSTAYYGAMEKVGIHKRDILVDQFGAVVQIENTDLKKAYDKLNAEYEDSEKAAKKVSERIDKVESVADDLFEEWEDELKLYKSADLRRSSQRKLQKTKTRYREMLASMHRAEKSMAPVLRTFRDNVLFLKHNLNAQAIGSLRSEFSTLKGEIDGLIKNMNEAIKTSNKFIADIKQ